MKPNVRLLASLAAIVFALLPAAGQAEERGKIYFGPDVEVRTLQQPRWQNCAARCNRNDACVGWTYIEGVKQCRLKEAIWLKADNGCCISGLREAADGRPGGGGGQPAAPGVENARILALHYNTRVQGRGLCIQSQPAVPRSLRGWACLWKDNPLYAEMDALLNEAHARDMACRIDWDDRPREGLAEITLVECRKRR